MVTHMDSGFGRAKCGCHIQDELDSCLGMTDIIQDCTCVDCLNTMKAEIEKQGSSLFLMDKMLFQFNRVGFCDDVHTKQRRAKNN
jgi:hypothetical protein